MRFGSDPGAIPGASTTSTSAGAVTPQRPFRSEAVVLQGPDVLLMGATSFDGPGRGESPHFVTVNDNDYQPSAIAA